MSRNVVIVEGLRTPFAKAGTDLKDVHPADLGEVALRELIAKTNLDTDLVDEVIVGNTGSPSDAVNIGRVVALRAGIPLKTSAYTVHRNCASALESVTSGFEKIKSGTMDVVLTGGTESMSQLPLIYNKKTTSWFIQMMSKKTAMQKIMHLKNLSLPALLNPKISVMEGLTDPFVGINMGKTAEILAKEFGISRLQQDEFATMSHTRAAAAQESGALKDEITPVFIPPKFKKVVHQDIGPRAGQTVEKLAKLRPYFDRKYGSITVGNACPLTDGAAMLLLMEEEKAKSLGYKPLARIRGYAFAGLEPERMGLGPVYSTPIALKRAGVEFKDLDLIELNEAFAAQVLACNKAFASDEFCQNKLGLSKALGEVDPNKLNVNGGAISLGHPVGATGTRLVLTLAKALKAQNKKLGLATLCIGGGQGGAIVIENMNV